MLPYKVHNRAAIIEAMRMMLAPGLADQLNIATQLAISLRHLAGILLPWHDNESPRQAGPIPYWERHSGTHLSKPTAAPPRGASDTQP